MSAIGHSLFSDFPLPSYIENNALKGRQLRFLQDQFHLKFLACKEGTGEGAPLHGRSRRCDCSKFSLFFTRSFSSQERAILQPQLEFEEGKEKQLRGG